MPLSVDWIHKLIVFVKNESNKLLRNYQRKEMIEDWSSKGRKGINRR